MPCVGIDRDRIGMGEGKSLISGGFIKVLLLIIIIIFK